MNTRLARVREGLIATSGQNSRLLRPEASVDALLASSDPSRKLAEWFEAGTDTSQPDYRSLLAPIESQEVWAAGVTYSRSRLARVAESSEAGADRFYDLVYQADRPELFFKATPNRVVGPNQAVRIRSDSTWNVPEPELTLVISSSGHVVGLTIGNDMSSRSIEGENPLYLPQAKVYTGCAALGPWLSITSELPSRETTISMWITRDGDEVFAGWTTIGEIVRPLGELVGYLFRSNEFAEGVFLMTGTGIVPDDDFTLKVGDTIAISIEGLGTLSKGS